MKEFKGTPGPWHWEGLVLGNDNFIVGGDSWRFKENDKNLIAAAPELLEALLRVRAQFDQAGISPVEGSLNPVEDNYAFINSVIAKALGESQ